MDSVDLTTKLDVSSTAEQLEKLGLTKAAGKLKQQQAMASKLTVAYEHYPFITREQVDQWIQRAAQEKHPKNPYMTKRLKFTALKDYEGVPPSDALTKLDEAMQRGCFDTFEVASVEWVEKVPDPIVFGRVNGCADRFFVAQWLDDISVEEFL